MGTTNPIRELSISGFKSIKRLDKLRLESLNVLLGANGAGKSNFVSYFGLLREILGNHLQVWTSKQGGAGGIRQECPLFNNWVEKLQDLQNQK